MNGRLYRPCVGIALFNAEGNVFVGERIDTPGAWQMPQGGIDAHEDIESAAFRELYEETGVKNAVILEIAAETICYDLPAPLKKDLWKGHFSGQEQRWVAMRFTGTDDSEIQLDAHDEPTEFSQWEWVALTETVERIVPFKRDVYAQVIALFKKYS